MKTNKKIMKKDDNRRLIIVVAYVLIVSIILMLGMGFILRVEQYNTATFIKNGYSQKVVTFYAGGQLRSKTIWIKDKIDYEK